MGRVRGVRRARERTATARRLTRDVRTPPLSSHATMPYPRTNEERVRLKDFLDEATRRRVKHIDEQMDILPLATRHVPLKDAERLVKTMHAYQDELDGIIRQAGFEWPDEEERARRADEARDNELQKQISPVAEQYKRRQAELDEEWAARVRQHERRDVQLNQLLADVRVDERYRRVAESVARYAVKRLGRGMPAPKIQFFHADGTANGCFKRYEPDRIHIAHDLDDEQLVKTTIHECHHYTAWPNDSEAAAKALVDELAPKYLDEHGWRSNGWWVAAA